MNRIYKLLKINEGEESKLSPFFLIAALLQAGISIGFSIADTEFLNSQGPEKLPQLFLMMPVMMLVITPLFSYWLSKRGALSVLRGALLLISVGGIVFYALFSMAGDSRPAPLVFAARLYAYLWMVSIYSIFWSFVDRYFTILDAKRLFAFFSAGLSFGGMIGGGLVGLLAESIPLSWFFPLWSLTSLLALPIVFRVKKHFVAFDIELEDDQESFLESIWSVFRESKKRPYVLYLNLALFLTLFLTTLAEFEYLKIFSENRSEKELIQLFGSLFFIANAINLLLNVFVFNRLIAALGVRNTTFILPFSYLVGFLFIWANPSFESALAVFFAYQTVMLAIDANNMNFIFNAVPEEKRSSVRALAEGLTDPFATCFAGLFLMLPQFFPTFQLDDRSIALWALGFLGLQLILLFLMRREYLYEMLIMLKKGWLNFSNELKKDELDSDEFNEEQIVSECENNESGQAKINAFSILKEYNPDKFTRMALEEALDKTSVDPRLYELLEESLEIAPSDTLKFILEWLTDKESRLPPEALSILGRYGLIQQAIIQKNQQDKDSKKRASAASILWSNFKLEDTDIAINILQGLFESQDPTEIIKGIEVIGNNGEEKYAHAIAEFLDREPGIRVATLDALNKLVSGKSARLWPKILPLCESNSPSEREKAILILEKIGDSASIMPLLKLTTRAEPREKRILQRFIQKTGLKLVPTLINILRDRSIAFLGRSIAARSLASLSFAQLELLNKSLILDELTFAYSTLEKSNLLGDSEDSQLLKLYYQDLLQETLEFTLEILALSGQLPNYELISASLRSDNAKLRGNAIETLEQAIPTSLFTVLLPLVDSRPIEQKIEFFHSYFRSEEVDLDQVLDEAITGPNELLQVTAAASLIAGSPEDALKNLRPLLDSQYDGSKDFYREVLKSHPGSVPMIAGLKNLASHPLTGSFPLPALYMLIKHAKFESVNENDTLFQEDQPITDCLVFVDAPIQNEQSVLNEELFYHKEIKFSQRKVDNANRFYRISRESIEEVVRLFPQVGIKMLELKSEEAVAS